MCARAGVCVCVCASVCLCRSDYGPWLRVTLCRLSCTASLILSINELRSTLLPRTPSINHNLSSVSPSAPTNLLSSPAMMHLLHLSCCCLPLKLLLSSTSPSCSVLFCTCSLSWLFLNLLVHRLRSPFSSLCCTCVSPSLHSHGQHTEWIFPLKSTF